MDIYLLGCRVHFEPGAFRSDHPVPGFFQEAQIFLPARLAILKVGQPRPPRLAIMLLSELVSNGSRGVLPPEAERRWAVSPAAVFQAPITVFPRQFPDGRPVPFCFEPGLPAGLAGQPALSVDHSPAAHPLPLSQRPLAGRYSIALRQVDASGTVAVRRRPQQPESRRYCRRQSGQGTDRSTDGLRQQLPGRRLSTRNGGSRGVCPHVG